MMKKTIVAAIILLAALPVAAQNKQEETLKREITLYNPYKPSLPDVVKKSFLPDMTDTARVRPEFTYEVNTYPFMPPYTISPIKAASLIPDPLPKLYNSFVNLGFGNHLTPLGEVSISNHRSKKGNIGFYGKHFSTNGNIDLGNSISAFAGYMDNDAMVYGRKVMRKAVAEGSVSYSNKTRYAYGYDTSMVYDPDKKDIRLTYNNIGLDLGIHSVLPDSSDLSYDFSLRYDHFFTGRWFRQNSIAFTGELAKEWKGFFVGAKAGLSLYMPSDSIIADTSRYIAVLNPYITKGTSEWNFRLGFQILADKSFTGNKLHLYPDLLFGFNVISSYLRFEAELSGRLERNLPPDVVVKNPYLLPGKAVYDLRNTDYPIVAKAGVRGETGINGIYNVFGSYSIVNDLLMFSNYALDFPAQYSRGNYFIPRYDQAEILNVHGDIYGEITDKLSFGAEANYYHYNLADNDFAWNMPDWDARLSLKYNLRNKILAGLGLNSAGKRMAHITDEDISPLLPPDRRIELPANFSLSLNAEYRYTKILSFWLRLDNLALSRQYEWAFYPSQRFFLLLGFKYSL